MLMVLSRDIKLVLLPKDTLRKKDLNDETFSPVVRLESVRSVIALASKNDLKLHQMDITTAFLNGDLEKEVCMKQSEGFPVEGQENSVCRLKRSIYGLKQSPRCLESGTGCTTEDNGF